MKNLAFILLLFYNLTIVAQGVKILDKADTGKLPESKKFTFLEPATDTVSFKYVATLQGTDKIRNANIEKLYFVIREKANELGANCYKISEFKTDSIINEVILILEAYYATDSLLDINRANHEKDVVYLFGNEKPGGKPISFKLNDEPKEIISGTYYKIKLKEGEQVKINKGGMTGTTMKLKLQGNKLPGFYSLSGFGLSGFERQPMNGISFTSGGINRIGNISLGLLLTKLLTQAN